MMYLLTPEVHAQIVDTLDTIEALFTNMDIQHLLAYREVEAALAILKAMKPVPPVGWQYKTNESGLFVSDQCPDDVEVWNDIEWNKPLYAKERQ